MRHAVLSVILGLILLALAGCTGGGAGHDGDDDGGDGETPTTNRTVEWGDLATATIRPGASLGGYCTYNFLFTDDRGNAFIGTAAHCTQHAERVVLGPGGPEIGTVVYDSDDSDLDFSLVLLDKDQVQNAHPQMFGWEGPTGTITSGEASTGDELTLYGYGVVLGDQEDTRPRNGVLMDEDGKHYRANMPAVNGDSGSPLLHASSGKAFGIVSHYGILAVPPATDEGPILPFILDELHAAGFPVELATI